MFGYQGEGKISRSELYRCCEVSDVKRCSKLAVVLQEGKYGAAVGASEGDVNIAVLGSLGVDHWGAFKGPLKGMKDWGAGQGGWSEFCGRLCPILGQWGVGA